LIYLEKKKKGTLHDAKLWFSSLAHYELLQSLIAVQPERCFPHPLLKITHNRNNIYSDFVFVFWAIQVGLLTPLTFAQHRLSPLAAFTSGAYFLHNGRW